MLRAKHFLLAGLFAISAAAQNSIFTGQTIIGDAGPKGDLAVLGDSTYKISAGGSNMWFNADAFFFVHKQVSGDVALAANIEIPASPGGDPHRKAVLMIRQSLD